MIKRQMPLHLINIIINQFFSKTVEFFSLPNQRLKHTLNQSLHLKNERQVLYKDLFFSFSLTSICGILKVYF